MKSKREYWFHSLSTSKKLFEWGSWFSVMYCHWSDYQKSIKLQLLESSIMMQASRTSSDQNVLVAMGIFYFYFNISWYRFLHLPSLSDPFCEKIRHKDLRICLRMTVNSFFRLIFVIIWLHDLKWLIVIHLCYGNSITIFHHLLLYNSKNQPS